MAPVEVISVPPSMHTERHTCLLRCKDTLPPLAGTQCFLHHLMQVLCSNIKASLYCSRAPAR